MAVIAVAGGTGNLGRTILDAIIATGNKKADPALEAEIGVPIIVVEYGNAEALTKILEENNIHTIVSAINMLPAKGATQELELIRAADASKTTKRIVVSDWFVPTTKEGDEKRLGTVATRRQSQAELQKTKNLEYTRFFAGFDYCLTGSGDVPAVFTHSNDLARYVAALLAVEKWDPIYYVIGDRVTWNEFVALAETAKGTRFTVTCDSMELVASGKVTELPSHVPIYEWLPQEAWQKTVTALGWWFADEAMDLKPDKTVNELFPEIRPLKVKDALEIAWKKPRSIEEAATRDG